MIAGGYSFGCGGVVRLYGILALARIWFAPFNPEVAISRSPRMLPVYAAYSLLRITIAYLLSLAFTLVYGYVAAYNTRAERILIPLLDVLQSIPVLSFLPGVMLAMVAGGVGFAPNPFDGSIFLFEPSRPLAPTIITNSDGLASPPMKATLFAIAAVLLFSAAMLSFGGWAAKQAMRRYGALQA